MRRERIGAAELAAVDGTQGQDVLAVVRRRSPTLADAVNDFAFGEIFSRAELGRRERELATVAVLGALGGAEPQLRVHLNGALNVGVDPDELVGLAEHLAVYAGFPRALNLLAAIDGCLGSTGAEPSLPARRMRIGDHETLVADTGGKGPPLVLIHALGLDRRMWREVVPMLARRFRVIAYDLRGHGHAAAAGGISLAAFTQDLRSLLGELGVSRASLAGLSLGGAIAQRFAVEDPGRVASLLLIATTAWSQPAFALRAEAAEQEGMERQVAATLTRWFTPAALAEDGWAVRYARERVRRALVSDWAASWRALMEIGDGSHLAKLCAPTALIAAAADVSTTPDIMRRMGEAVAGSTFDLVEGAPHMVSLESPTALAEAMERRLADHRRI